MILYLDTSSLVKLVRKDEVHADQVRMWAATADTLATSRVALPEAAAALARRHRLGGLTRRQLTRALSQLGHAWPDYFALDIDERRAARLAVTHGLRGFDAVHLAAALTVRDALGPDGVAFTSFDAELVRAAIAEKLLVLEPPAA